MGLIIKGKEVIVPGLTVLSWKDDPVLRIAQTDLTTRPETWIRAIVLHTTNGI